MTSIGSRRVARTVPVLVVLLLAVVGGRQLIGSTHHNAAATAASATIVESSSDHGLLAIVSRVPAPVTEARLDLGADAPVGADVLLVLWWTAVAIGVRGLASDSLGVHWRRRGPPVVLAF